MEKGTEPMTSRFQANQINFYPTKTFLCACSSRSSFLIKPVYKIVLYLRQEDAAKYVCPFSQHIGCNKVFYRFDKLKDHVKVHGK